VSAPDPGASAAPTRPGFERVADVAALPPGTLLGVTAARGETICLFNRGGRIGAVAGLCTHQAFPMADGVLQPDGTIECSWHGARFDCESGVVRDGPAMDPIAVYETRVDEDGIWVGPRR
jgi:nitrite reductase/ring-hydroxylating ferredoxin subunit